MASSAERMASSINFGSIGKAEELKKRIWFVVLALVVYRLGTYIPVPGIDSRILAEIFEGNSGGLVDMFNMFSGGALSRMTIFALNIMPYITVSIIMQLLTVMVPTLAELKKDGEAGRRKIQQYTRYGTIFMAAIQGYGIATYLTSLSGPNGESITLISGWQFYFITVVTLVGGVMFLMWLGEQITSRGIGNGISLIIFAGIVAELPKSLVSTFDLGRDGTLSTPLLLFILVLTVALLMFIVFMESAQRRILVQYPKRQIGNKQFGGESSHLPLKINTAGVLPPIFASSLLLFPATVTNFHQPEVGSVLSEIVRLFNHGQPLYILSFVILIVFFCFFYTKHVFNPSDTADNLKSNNGFVPGIRPGKSTAQYLEKVLNRLTVVGAAYISLVCVIPELLLTKYQVPFYLGGTSLLIVVNVSMDTVGQIQSHLLAHQYEGMIKKSKIHKTGRKKR